MRRPSTEGTCQSLPELKGKYKMRIAEITIAPGGHVGDHNHLGPGIRQMTAGEMECLLPDKTMFGFSSVEEAR
jgi:hypothetical protein